MKRKAPSNNQQASTTPYAIKTRSKTEAEKKQKVPKPKSEKASKREKEPALPTRKSARLSKSNTGIPEEVEKPMSEKKKSKSEPAMNTESDNNNNTPMDEDQHEHEQEQDDTKSTSSSEASPVSSTSALQGLMRRLGGAALEELLPAGLTGGREGAVSMISTLIEGRARLKPLLQGLKSDNESQQLECIMELCDYLSIGTEESLAGFAVDQFVPALINLLNFEHNPDMMLLACRALSNLMEALPGSCATVVHHGAVPSLCSKLLSIEYIDLAEQSLQALEKISTEHPSAVLRAGGLMAVLTYLDFFPTNVQRVAVATAANICRQVPVESFDMVNDSIPILTNLLQYSDQKVVENSCLCFMRLSDSFYGSEEKLMALASNGLISQLVRLVSISNTAANTISPGTYTIIVRLLANLCFGAPTLVLPLLQEGIATLLQSVLVSTSDPGAATPIANSIAKSPQQCYEVLSLVNELLPRLPAEIADLMAHSTKLAARERVRKIPRKSTDTTAEVDAREEIFKAQPELLVNLGQCLFSVLVDTFTSTVNPSVRYKSLSAITKMLYFSTSDMLAELLRNLAFSSFLAGLLASRDNAVVAVALTMAEIGMEKLPSVFSKYFRREGVVYEVERLTKMDPPASGVASPGPKSPAPTSGVGSPAPEPASPIPVVHTPPGGVLSTPPAHSMVPMSSSPSSAAFFHVGSPASIHTATTTAGPNDDMKAVVYSKARMFHSKYFKKLLGNNMDTSATDELVRLQDLSNRLNKEQTKGGDLDVLKTIRDMMTITEGVSTFEFLRSGLIESLLCYLTKMDGGAEGVEQRAIYFSQVFMESTTHQTAQATSTLGLLVTKLHDALNKLERFPINVNDTPGTASGLKYLTQPFKLRLQKDEGSDEILKDYATNVVLIEPLATVSAIEDFLFPKVKGSQFTSESSSKSKGKDKEKEKDTEKDTEKEKEKEKEPKTPERTPPKKEKSRKAEEDDTKQEGGKRMKEESPTSSSSVSVTKMDVDEDKDDDEDEGDNMVYDEYDEYDDEQVMSPAGDDVAEDKVHDLKLNEDGSSSASSTPQKATNTTTPPPQPTSSSPSPFIASAQNLANLKLAFFVNDQRLPSTMSIFQAIQKLNKGELYETSPTPMHRLWETVYTLKYRLIPKDLDSTSNSTTSSNLDANLEPIASSSLVKFLSDMHPFELSAPDNNYEILSLLRVLYQFNDKWATLYKKSGTPLLLPSEFINNRLTAKLLRQLQDPLAMCSGTLPTWCKQLAEACPFLFTLECRRQFLYCTSFGIARALQYLQQRNDIARVSGERSEFRIGRIQRQKVRISRSRLLESAMKVMKLYGKDKAVLEVEYFGEVGTGLGPTLEFYTLVSRELQKTELGLWWNDNTTSTSTTTSTTTGKSDPDYVFCTGGLFPVPLRAKSAGYEQKLELFKFMGSFVAKALLDNRLLDIPLSTAFIKWILGQELDFDDFFHISPSMAKSLQGLLRLCVDKRAIERDDALTAAQRSEKIKGLNIGGASVEDLCLDFTLPGHSDWELKPNGTDIPVTILNLEEYVDLVLRYFLVDGVKAQFRAFNEGFSQVLPVENIHIFFVPEIETLVCGSAPGCNEDWSVDALMDAIKADHGYTSDSQAVRLLVEVMSEFTPAERRKFLLFLTGSTRLPISGFKGLNPRFTIVKKQHDAPLTPNDYLPSVMSCTNYLKLPDYSSKDILKQKLLYAIEEGQASFHLS